MNVDAYWNKFDKIWSVDFVIQINLYDVISCTCKQWYMQVIQ